MPNIHIGMSRHLHLSLVLVYATLLQYPMVLQSLASKFFKNALFSSSVPCYCYPEIHFILSHVWTTPLPYVAAAPSNTPLCLFRLVPELEAEYAYLHNMVVRLFDTGVG